MSDIQNKYDLFLIVAKGLNKTFDVSPVLFGSLGLYLQLRMEKNVEDIDMLLPRAFTHERLEELKTFMIEQGFEVVSEEKHGFSNGMHEIEFSSYEKLLDLADISVEDLKKEEENGAEFYMLSLRQYLILYEKMSEDPERAKTKGVQDLEKIRLIKQELIAG